MEKPAITDSEKDAGAVAPSAPGNPFLVTFAQPFDTENPKDWPLRKKWAVTGVLSTTAFNRIMISTIMAPALPAIQQDLKMSDVESVMAMSVYLLATAFGPLLIGPLSEVYGRYPVLQLTNVWFLAFNIICGFARNKAMLMTGRFLAGFGGSAIYALAGGVLGDVWTPEQRGRSLGLYSLVPLLGAAVGPIVGGFVTENISWRWIFWSTSALQGALVCLSLALFRETHAPTILRHKAARLRRNLGNTNYYTAIERLEQDRSVFWVLARSISRPIRLLVFHPIIQIQACLSGFNYGMLYLMLTTFANIWVTQYHESLSISSLHYLALCFGEIAGAQIGGPLMDVSYLKLKARAGGEGAPEFRVPMMLPGAVLTPIGLLLYGWAAQAHLHWSVVDLGGFIVSFGLQLFGQATQGYTIDSYPDHVASSQAATQFLRSMTAFGFPLFAPKMYTALGYGWGNSTLAFIAIGIGIPAPLLVWKFGRKLREKAQSSY